MVYVFWFRSVVQGYLSAWKLESFKLQKMKKPTISLSNEMLLFQTIQLLLILFIYFIFPLKAVFLFLCVETLAFFFLKLLITLSTTDFFANTMVITLKKSCPFTVGTATIQLEEFYFLNCLDTVTITKSNRKYQTLQFEHSPQMPTGYPGMILMSLIPPLWFYIMNKKLDLLKARESELLD